MPALYNKFTNDIVSLTVLALMVVAFVAAQAGATAPATHSAMGDRPAATERPIAVDHDSGLRIFGE